MKPSQSQGRRVSKTVSTSPDGTTWTVATDPRFLYDGWNLIAEYSAPLPTSTTLTHEASYLWGNDLSGTPQGAGGVGGLLAVFEISNSEISNRSYPAYDGNGNISAWISASGTLLTRMDYSPFGQLIAHHKFTTDATLSRLPFGFSTKYTDPETGLLYYGHRYYDPVHGRWQSRDPIGERGGGNLYGFVGNDGIRVTDRLGLDNIVMMNMIRDQLEATRKAKENARFRDELPRPGWLRYSSIYEQKDGKPLSDLELWNLLWSQPGVFDNHPHLPERRRPPAGSPVVNNGVLNTNNRGVLGWTDLDALPEIEARADCCLDGKVVMRVNFLFLNVAIMSDLINRAFITYLTGGGRYYDIAAHELGHIRAYSGRVKKIVDEINATSRPCYKDMPEAIKKAEELQRNLSNTFRDAHNLEGEHPDDGFGSPGNVKWVGNLPS